MKSKSIGFLIAFLFLFFVGHGQTIEEDDKITASISVTKTEENEINLTFHFELEEGWGMNFDISEMNSHLLKTDSLADKIRISKLSGNGIYYYFYEQFFGESPPFFIGKFSVSQTINWDSSVSNFTHTLAFELNNIIKDYHVINRYKIFKINLNAKCKKLIISNFHISKFSVGDIPIGSTIHLKIKDLTYRLPTG